MDISVLVNQSHYLEILQGIEVFGLMRKNGLCFVLLREIGIALSR